MNHDEIIPTKSVGPRRVRWGRERAMCSFKLFYHLSNIATTLPSHDPSTPPPGLYIHHLLGLVGKGPWGREAHTWWDPAAGQSKRVGF